MTVVESLRASVIARRRTAGHEVGFVLAGIAALALSARISFEIGPVPITAQTLVVLLVGAFLGSLRGAITTAGYVLLGLAGAPVFARGGGAVYILGPTGGYLLGFILAAFVVGALVERGWGRSLPLMLAALVIGDAVIFAGGLARLSFFALPGSLLMTGLVPFLPCEIAKIAAAAVVLTRARR